MSGRILTSPHSGAGVPKSEHIRSFVAVDLSEQVLGGLAALQEELVQLHPDVRWVRPTGMHVTLKFLGWVEPERLERAHAVLASALDDAAPLHVCVRGVGAFPSLRRPRVLWVGLHAAGLSALAERVDAALASLGFETERRAFTPHVTLGRVNSLRDWPRVAERLTTHLEDDFGETDVDVVTVYRSTLRPSGAIYTPLWTIPLTGNKERTTV